MAPLTELTPAELERLLTSIDAGAYDDQVSVPKSREPTLVQKFADVTPFDVRAWAARRGIELPGS